MSLLEAALAAEGDPAALIAGAAQPTGIRRLALGMLSVEDAASEAFDAITPGRSKPAAS